MTTPNINSAPFNSINVLYPVAGIDNDSQGFRTAYSQIQQSFVAANVDITGLWANVDSLNTNVAGLEANVGGVGNLGANVTILQANVATIQGNITTIDATALFKNTANHLGGNIIDGATQTFYNSLSIGTGTANVDYNLGGFQYLPVTANANVAFLNWPLTANAYAKLGVLFNIPAGVAITFPASVTGTPDLTGWDKILLSNVASIQGSFGSTLMSLQSGNYLFEFSTFNGGTTVLIDERFYP